MSIVRLFFWISQKLLFVVFIPYSIYNFFKKRRVCPPLTNKLLFLSASELTKEIQDKKLSCVEVIEAYIERVKEVNPFINAVIQDRFDEALIDAKNVDQLLNNNNSMANKPLLGVPITIKGNFSLMGYVCNSGRVAQNVIAKVDADIIKKIKDAGAIPLLVSSLPEFGISWETSNNVIGTTKNPYNLNRTSGGSSGGECSLLASGASVIGLGNDIAGSLRVPAHFCGVFGHKPSLQLVPWEGSYPLLDAEQIGSHGPLTRYASDLRLLLNIIIKPEAKILVNLNNKIDITTLKIYYVNDCGSILMQRVNRETRNFLQEVTDYFNQICLTPCTKVKIPLLKKCPELFYKSFCNIDCTEISKGCYMELLRYITFRSKVKFYVILFGILYRLIPRLTPKSVKKRTDEDVEALKKYFQNLLRDNGVFICPTFPTEAHYHGEIYKKIFDVSHAAIFSILGLPVTQCPIGLTSKGLPIGIQIVGNVNSDNLTISVAEELEKKFGGWKPILNENNNYV